MVFPRHEPDFGSEAEFGSEEPGPACAAGSLDAGAACFRTHNIGGCQCAARQPEAQLPRLSVAEVHRDSAIGRVRGSRGAGLGSRPTMSCRLEVELGVQRHVHSLFKRGGVNTEDLRLGHASA
jgi:hypothetical protein